MTSTTTAFDRLVDTLRDHGSTVKENRPGQSHSAMPRPQRRRPRCRSAHAATAKASSSTATPAATKPPCSMRSGIPPRDLFDDPRMRAAYDGHSPYDYADGRKVHRKPGKQFHQSGNTKGDGAISRRPIGNAEPCTSRRRKRRAGHRSHRRDRGLLRDGAGKAHLADWTPLTGKHVDHRRRQRQTRPQARRDRSPSSSTASRRQCQIKGPRSARMPPTTSPR